MSPTEIIGDKPEAEQSMTVYVAGRFTTADATAEPPGDNLYLRFIGSSFSTAVSNPSWLIGGGMTAPCDWKRHLSTSVNIVIVDGALPGCRTVNVAYARWLAAAVPTVPLWSVQ